MIALCPVLAQGTAYPARDNCCNIPGSIFGEFEIYKVNDFSVVQREQGYIPTIDQPPVLHRYSVEPFVRDDRTTCPRRTGSNVHRNALRVPEDFTEIR